MKRVTIKRAAPATKASGRPAAVALHEITITKGDGSSLEFSNDQAAPIEQARSALSVSGYPLMEAVCRGEQPCPPPGQPLYAKADVSQMTVDAKVSALPEFPTRNLSEAERDLVHWYRWEPSTTIALTPRLTPPREPEASAQAEKLGISKTRFARIHALLHPALKHTRPGPPPKTPK